MYLKAKDTYTNGTTTIQIKGKEQCHITLICYLWLYLGGCCGGACVLVQSDVDGRIPHSSEVIMTYRYEQQETNYDMFCLPISARIRTSDAASNLHRRSLSVSQVYRRSCTGGLHSNHFRRSQSLRQTCTDPPLVHESRGKREKTRRAFFLCCFIITGNFFVAGIGSTHGEQYKIGIGCTRVRKTLDTPTALCRGAYEHGSAAADNFVLGILQGGYCCREVHHQGAASACRYTGPISGTILVGLHLGLHVHSYERLHIIGLSVCVGILLPSRNRNKHSLGCISYYTDKS